jgi:hypothetical protein
MSEIANKGRVRRWTLDRCPDCTDSSMTHLFDEPVDVVEAAPLKNLLTELADAWEERGDLVQAETPAMTGTFYACASELRHLITEQLGEER